MFDLDQYMQVRRRLVEAAIDARLPAPDTRPALLHEAMRYAVTPGGKRLRPILCCAAAEAVGADPSTALDPAVAVELLHSYTLIHDDLPCMDDDDARRGKPAVHKAFGEDIAVLAGDALQALAFESAASAEPEGDWTAADLALELAAAAGSRGVVGGQAEDVRLETADVSVERIHFVHLHKTADLFRAATRMGGMAGGASGPQLAHLTTYGNTLGLAFQITDDLLDAEGGERDETSCLLVWEPDAARRRAAELARRAVAAADELPGTGKEPLVALARKVAERTS